MKFVTVKVTIPTLGSCSLVVKTIEHSTTSFEASVLYKKFYSGGGLGGRGLRFKKEFLERLPIPLMPELDYLFNNFHDILSFTAHSLKNKTFKNISDGIVFDLYFSEHMKKLEIQVLEYIARDIDKVLKLRTFEHIPNEEKENLVSQLHAKWSDPDNEVVKRMAMFKEKSPDILKVILES